MPRSFVGEIRIKLLNVLQRYKQPKLKMLNVLQKYK